MYKFESLEDLKGLVSLKKAENEVKVAKKFYKKNLNYDYKLVFYGFSHFLSDKGIIKELAREYKLMFFKVGPIREYIGKYWYQLFLEVFREIRIRDLKRNMRAVIRKEIQEGLLSYYISMKGRKSFDQKLSKVAGIKKRKNYRLSPVYSVARLALRSSKRDPYINYPFFFVLLKKIFPLIIHLYKGSRIPVESIDTDKCLKTVLYFTREKLLDFILKVPEDKLQELLNLQKSTSLEELRCSYPPKIEEIETLSHMYLFLKNWKPDKFYRSCMLALEEIKTADILSD